jgi:hypothetical protein
MLVAGAEINPRFSRADFRGVRYAGTLDGALIRGEFGAITSFSPTKTSRLSTNPRIQIGGKLSASDDRNGVFPPCGEIPFWSGDCSGVFPLEGCFAREGSACLGSRRRANIECDLRMRLPVCVFLRIGSSALNGSLISTVLCSVLSFFLGFGLV